jgi:methionine synthase I (cobalamin-dependent)
MEKPWQQKLGADQIVLIDGATGTELQRRGVPMVVTEALGWVEAGVRLLGGCCGTSPDHIKALQAAIPELEAARRA